MAKLKTIAELSLEGQKTRLTHFKQFLDKVDARNDGRFYYQDVKLSKCTDRKKMLFQLFIMVVLRGISENVKRKFKNILKLSVFSSLVSLLDTSIWPSNDENLATFGENQILEVIKHFNDILLSNSCNICQVQTEWDRLKNRIRCILENILKETYLNIKKNFFYQ